MWIIHAVSPKIIFVEGGEFRQIAGYKNFGPGLRIETSRYIWDSDRKISVGVILGLLVGNTRYTWTRKMKTIPFLLPDLGENGISTMFLKISVFISK